MRSWLFDSTVAAKSWVGVANVAASRFAVVAAPDAIAEVAAFAAVRWRPAHGRSAALSHFTAVAVGAKGGRQHRGGPCTPSAARRPR